MLSTQLIILYYSVVLSNQCSTTVSLETYPLSTKGRWLQRFHQHGIWPQQVDKEVIRRYLSGVRSIWKREKCFCLKSAFCVYMKFAFCTDHTLNFNFQPCSVLIDWLEPNQLSCWDLCTYIIIMLILSTKCIHIFWFPSKMVSFLAQIYLRIHKKLVVIPIVSKYFGVLVLCVQI